jgi:SAM-dependent methyltransferase
VRQPLLTILRCPVCGGAVEPDEFLDEMDHGMLRCLSCGESFQVDRGMPLMLSDRLPGIAEKKREIGGWVEKAKGEAWYEPEEEVDTNLPFVCRELGWDDPVWASNEYSFSRFLEGWVRPGLKILELGAAKTWASQHLLPRGAEYVATDIVDDDKIGIGRGAFFAERVGHYERVQADGEHLPFANGSFDLTFCVATLHHALDLPKMVAEMSRVTKRGGAVVALNEGTRPLGWSDEAPAQEGEKALGINEHTHTAWAYLAAFARAGILVKELYPANGKVLGKNGRWSALATLRAHTFHGKALGYDGISLAGTKLR